MKMCKGLLAVMNDYPIAKDWDGEPIYEGEYVYETPYGEYVKEEDLSRWINDTLGRPRELWREDSWQN